MQVFDVPVLALTKDELTCPDPYRDFTGLDAVFIVGRDANDVLAIYGAQMVASGVVEDFRSGLFAENDGLRQVA